MKKTHSELWALVARLHNLQEIFRIQGEILLHGEGTVEPLTELLLSPPFPFPEARVAAAECLGIIGTDHAIDALICVLHHHDMHALTPVQRFAEETVRNAAARQLSRFSLPRVADALFASLRQDHLIEAGVALAQLNDARALPSLLECLEDDVKKEKATEALRHFGDAAIPFLQEALRRPRLVEGMEPPISQERRSRAVALLGELGARAAIADLRRGLRDEITTVRSECALALVALLGLEAQETIPLLIVGLADPDFLMQTRCEEAVGTLGKPAVPALLQGAQGAPLPLPSGETARLSLRERLAALRLFCKLSDLEDPAVSTALCLLLRDQEEQIRAYAIQALGRCSAPHVRTVLEQTARHDGSQIVKSLARRTLGLRQKKGWSYHALWRVVALY